MIPQSGEINERRGDAETYVWQNGISCGSNYNQLHFREGENLCLKLNVSVPNLNATYSINKDKLRAVD